MTPKTEVVSLYTLSASSSLSVLSYFVIIRNPRLAEIWSQETHSYDPFPVNLNSLFLKQELNSRCYDALLNLAGNV